MGIDYAFNLGIGFVLDREDVLAPFRVEREEKFHMEDRFNPKTGKKVEPAKVVDEEAGEAFILDGTHHDDDWSFLEALSQKLGCDITNQGGYSDDQTLYFTVKVKTTGEDGLEDGRMTVGYSIAFVTVIESSSSVMLLAAKLKKLGIEPGVAKVFVQPDIS